MILGLVSALAMAADVYCTVVFKGSEDQPSTTILSKHRDRMLGVILVVGLLWLIGLFWYSCVVEHCNQPIIVWVVKVSTWLVLCSPVVYNWTILVVFAIDVLLHARVRRGTSLLCSGFKEWEQSHSGHHSCRYDGRIHARSA